MLSVKIEAYKYVCFFRKKDTLINKQKPYKQHKIAFVFIHCYAQYDMNRFMGMMPSSEVKREERFKVGMSQLVVTIQSGENGWTILYADSSSEYEDEVDTIDKNFDKAMVVLKTQFGDIKKVG